MAATTADGAADESSARLAELLNDIRKAATADICVEGQLSRAKDALILFKAEAQELSSDLRAIHVARACDFQAELRELYLLSQATHFTFADLPMDAIRSVCMHLPSTDLARLCLSFSAAYRCCDRAFRAERAADSGLETYLVGNVPLQVLAVHETLGASLSSLTSSLKGTMCVPPDYCAQIGFEFGGYMIDDDDASESGVPHSRARIRAIAEVMQRHPNSTAVIETHVGIGAPPHVAASYCVHRGAVIAALLVWYHNIAVERLTVRAWGKRITKHARRSTHPNGNCARAGYGWGEIFVVLDGTLMPCRPDYYGHGVGCACELGGTGDDGELASRVSDAVPMLRAALRGRLGPARLPPPNDEEEDEEEDEGEEEEEEEESDDESDDDDDDGEDGSRIQLLSIE